MTLAHTVHLHTNRKDIRNFISRSGLQLKYSSHHMAEIISDSTADSSYLTILTYQYLLPNSLWGLTSFFPCLIPNFCDQVTIMEIHWFSGNLVFLDSEKHIRVPVPYDKGGTEDVTHFLLTCRALKSEWKFFCKSLLFETDICCSQDNF